MVETPRLQAKQGSAIWSRIATISRSFKTQIAFVDDKLEHLDFEVFYVHRSVVRKYRPDFLVRLKSGDMLVLETKGQDSEQNQPKRRFLDEWVNAVNAHGGFGRWVGNVSGAPGDIQGILSRRAGTGGA